MTATQSPTKTLTTTRTPTSAPSQTPTPTETFVPTHTPTRAGCPAYDLDNQLPVSITGTTTGGSNLISGASCGDGGDNAPDATYLLVAPADGRYNIDTEGSSLTTILSVRNGDCAGPQLACRASDSEVKAHVAVDLFAGQTIVIVVDGYAGYSGNYVLSVQGPPPQPTPTATPGDCCTSNRAAGCAQADCATCVCAADPFCCSTLWDGLCAQETSGACASSCACAISAVEMPTPTPTPAPTTTPPETPIASPRPVAILTPHDGTTVSTSPITVTGSALEADTVVVNGVTAGLTGTTFTATVTLIEGVNPIVATATSAAGSISETVYAVLDTVAPPAPVLRLITIGTNSTGPGTVTGTLGSVEPRSIVTVTNARTDETATAFADQSGAFVANLGAQAGDHLSIFVTDRAGNVGPPGVLHVGTLTIAITAPVSGLSVQGDRVTVSGTVQTGPNIGVVVNGVSAFVEGGTFVAPSVPLLSGSNVIAATATDLRGDRASDGVSVTSQGVPATLSVSTEPTSGVAPFLTTFTYRLLSGRTVQSLAIDFDGDGSDDLTTSDPNTPLQHTYETPGIYTARLRVTDDQATGSEATVAVQALALADMDALFQRLWSGMNDALIAGDKETALMFLTPGAQDKYGLVFNMLMPSMPGIIGSYSALQPGALSPSIAEYAINRMIDGRDRIFLVYFLKDTDGVWRIDTM